MLLTSTHKAHCAYTCAQILVMDEATAAMDSETDQTLQVTTTHSVLQYSFRQLLQLMPVSKWLFMNSGCPRTRISSLNGLDYRPQNK